jgi:hypothetical protein
MDSISASPGNPLYSLIAMASSTSPGSSGGAAAASTGDSVSPAVSLELSSVQLQGQLMSTLLSGSTLSQLNAQGSSAMTYLSPLLASQGLHVNAVA